MSLQDSLGQAIPNAPIEQKPRANIYTMMLVISLFAIIVACIVLWMELKQYGDFPWWDTKGVGPAATSLAPMVPELTPRIELAAHLA